MKIILVITIAQLATQATHYLILKKNFGTVRASSLVTMFFILLTLPLEFEIKNLLHAACLGASFVGMSDPKRLNVFQLAMASACFVFIFYFFIHLFKGLGGALGLSAFISCLLIYQFSQQMSRLKLMRRQF